MLIDEMYDEFFRVWGLCINGTENGNKHGKIF